MRIRPWQKRVIDDDLGLKGRLVMDGERRVGMDREREFFLSSSGLIGLS